MEPVFGQVGEVPRRNTCDGDNLSPALRWSDPPAGTRAQAVVVTDRDAAATFFHWTLYDLPPRTRSLREGDAPPGALEGRNSFGGAGYGGPCPPKGEKPHRYVFTVYALKRRLGLRAGASPSDVFSAVKESATARGQVIGRFGR